MIKEEEGTERPGIQTKKSCRASRITGEIRNFISFFPHHHVCPFISVFIYFEFHVSPTVWRIQVEREERGGRWMTLILSLLGLERLPQVRACRFSSFCGFGFVNFSKSLELRE